MKRLIITSILAAALSTGVAADMELTNIVCFVRFSDQSDAVRINNYQAVETMMNSESEEENSVWRYYHDTSYGALSWRSHVVKVDYQDSRPRNYYCPQSASNPDGYSMLIQGYMREQTLIKELCKAIEDQVPADLKLDGNKDWEVDNLTIVVLGNSDSSSSYLLWPHQNTMTWAGATLHDYDIKSYLMIFDGANGAHALNPGVICHEMMHALDAYDLYSNGKLDPVGKWDLMSDNQTIPQGMTAYMRHEYGRKWGNWIPEIKTLDADGTYTLKPIYSETPEDVAYIIKPDASRSEYFMIEYRRKTGWDATIPSSGLICYRINPDVSSNLASSKFELYIFRPDGSLSNKGNLDKANFNSTVRRSQFGVDDTYYPYYSDGTRADFALKEIGKAEEDGIQFTLSLSSASISLTPNDQLDLIYNAQAQQVTAPGASISIYTIGGELVKQGYETIDTSDLTSGLYIVHATSNLRGNQTIKFIKNI